MTDIWPLWQSCDGHTVTGRLTWQMTALTVYSRCLTVKDIRLTKSGVVNRGLALLIPSLVWYHWWYWISALITSESYRFPRISRFTLLQAFCSAVIWLYMTVKWPSRSDLTSRVIWHIRIPSACRPHRLINIFYTTHIWVKP